MKTCPRCNGRKKLLCPKCKGSAEHPKGKLCMNCTIGMIDCPKCGGSGQVR